MKYNFRLLLHFFLHRSSYVDQPSYYLECPRKNRTEITMDFVKVSFGCIGIQTICGGKA